MCVYGLCCFCDNIDDKWTECILMDLCPLQLYYSCGSMSSPSGIFFNVRALLSLNWHIQSLGQYGQIIIIIDLCCARFCKRKTIYFITLTRQISNSYSIITQRPCPFNESQTVRTIEYSMKHQRLSKDRNSKTDFQSCS